MFARTPRLLLRPGWMEDAPALAQAIGDPAVLRNLTRAPSPYGLEDALAFLERPQDVHLPSLLAFTRTHGAPRLADNGASGNVLRKLGFRQTGRVEPRFSPARGDTAPCLILEEGGVARRGDDPAMDLYADAMPAMAA